MIPLKMWQILNVKSNQNLLFEEHTITNSVQKEWSYSYTCDQEIYRFTTLDYGQRWLVLNPIPNDKLQVKKKSHVHQLCDLRFK